MTHRPKVAEPGLARVKLAIAELALAGTISLASVAGHLETSPRTLQRRLSEAGLTFRALVEDSRFQIAGALLRDTDLKVQVIAARLGYGTPGAFSRAFSRLAGHSPTAYRKTFTGRRRAASEWREMGRSATPPDVGFAEPNEFPEER